MTAKRTKHRKPTVIEAAAPPTPSRLHDDLELIPHTEAARLLGCTPGSLEVWRSTRRYKIPYTKIGRKIYYQYGDLRHFIESLRVEPDGKGKVRRG